MEGLSALHALYVRCRKLMKTIRVTIDDRTIYINPSSIAYIEGRDDHNPNSAYVDIHFGGGDKLNLTGAQAVAFYAGWRAMLV